MRKRIILIIPILIVLLSSCKNTPALNESLSGDNGLSNSNPTPTKITPDEGMGGITGIIDNTSEFWGDEKLTIYAAEFYGDVQGDGFYLLEPNIFPQTLVHPSGIFQINNVKPGNYVLIIGPEPTSAKVIRNGNRPFICEVKEGEIFSLVKIHLTP